MRGLEYLDQDDLEVVEPIRPKRHHERIHLQDLQRPQALAPRARTVARREERRVKDQQHLG